MASFRLDRLSALEAIVGSNFRPTQAMQRRWQVFCEKIEGAFDAQDTINAALADKQAQLDAQLTQIIAAQAAADTAHLNDSISGSWLSPDTVLSAVDAGTDASITIANHSRKYGDGTAVAITGTTLTGLAYSTELHIYYDDTARTGGAVTYHATIDPNDAGNNAATGRHYVGSITTPAALGDPTAGTGSRPPGYTGVGNIP